MAKPWLSGEEKICRYLELYPYCANKVLKGENPWPVAIMLNLETFVVYGEDP